VLLAIKLSINVSYKTASRKEQMVGFFAALFLFPAYEWGSPTGGVDEHKKERRGDAEKVVVTK
jgi:hypothetical protein